MLTRSKDERHCCENYKNTFAMRYLPVHWSGAGADIKLFYKIIKRNICYFL